MSEQNSSVAEAKLRGFLLPELNLPYFKLLKESLQAQGLEIKGGWAFPRRGILFDQPYDFIHIHMLDSLFLRGTPIRQLSRVALFFLITLPFMKLRKIPLIWTCHEIDSHDEERVHWTRFLASLMMRLADSIIIHSQQVAEEILQMFPKAKKKIHLIPHGDLRPFYAEYISQDPIIRDSSVTTFHAIGFMRPDKGQDLIVKAFLKANRPDWRLRLIGGSEDKNFMQQLEILCNGDSRIEIKLGRLSDKEVVQYHEQADVIIFGFRRCATSGSLITAMALGSVIISPWIGHARELLDHDCAWLANCKLDEIDGLKQSMEAAASNKAKNQLLAQAAQERISQDSWEHISKCHWQVYTRL